MTITEPPTIRNLFDPSPTAAGETFEQLAAGGAFRLERIVSRGAASAPGFWYEQPEPEWVALLAGSATLELGDGTRLALGSGDYLLLPAGLEHRVATVSDDAVWLAVHFASTPPGSAGQG